MKYKQLDLFSTYPPPIILWENVPGVLSTADNAFGCLLAGLCGSDIPITVSYKRWPDAGIVTGEKRTVAWRVFNSKYFGVPQQRKRIFLIASSRKELNPAKVLFEYPSVCRDIGKSAQEKERITSFVEGSFGGYSQSESAGTLRASGGTNGGGSETLIIDTSHANEVIRETKNIVPTLKARMGTGGNNVPMLIDNKRLRKLTPLECERLQGFPDNWTQIAYRGKAAADCPDSPRYKAIGNSWAVPVARWIGERIQHALRSRNENHGQ